MHDPADALQRVTPPLRTGERVSLQTRAAGAAHDALGYITALTEQTVRLVDRRGTEHIIDRATVVGVRRIPVARGRNPLTTPPGLLDDLAARAGAIGEPWVVRLSALLAGLPAPTAVPAWGPSATIAGVDVRVEGEWVTLADGSATVWVAAGWWATRQGARSMQVRTTDPRTRERLAAAGFTAVGAP
ncbi:MAG: hypothetical protein ACK5LS_04005 [Propioniciclava sp.]